MISSLALVMPEAVAVMGALMLGLERLVGPGKRKIAGCNEIGGLQRSFVIPAIYS